MAKINFGGVVQDARGKQNGLVYSKNKSGAYVRRKVTPANPQSPSQSGRRSNFGILAKDWSGLLTDVQRSNWISYAQTYPRLDIFGASINISGLNMYISLNQVLLGLGTSKILNPPASNVVTPIAFDPTSLVAVTPNTVQFNQTVASASGNLKFYIFGARPLPAGRTVQKNDWRFINAQIGVVGPYPAVVDVGTDYQAKFGAFTTGQRVSILVATVDTTSGLTTVGTTLSIIA